MGRNRYGGYFEETHRGFLVAFDLQWKVIESRRVDQQQGAPRAALIDFIREHQENGWHIESDGSYGFTFESRDGQRLLLEVTPRDPYDTSAFEFQSVQVESSSPIEQLQMGADVAFL